MDGVSSLAAPDPAAKRCTVIGGAIWSPSAFNRGADCRTKPPIRECGQESWPDNRRGVMSVPPHPGVSSRTTSKEPSSRVEPVADTHGEEQTRGSNVLR